MDYIIQTEGLSKTYDGTVALRALDLAVPPNSIFGFLGPNGAGKTTTMKLLLGLIRPSAGSATIFGMDSQEDSVAIRARIGYLPQDPSFYEFMTARETLDFTARFYFKGPDKAIRERVEEVLALVGLADIADRSIKGFSGGERQRLGIAQAQVNYPDLLILDEPAASLDPLGRHDVLSVLSRLRRHTTIFYSTHILDDVQQISDTVAILNRGELVAHGPIETLLAGRDGTIYRLEVAGHLDGAADRVRQAAYISDVRILPAKDGETWLVSVADEATARQALLRLVLADPGLEVLSFGRKRYELEEVFINIVGGGSHGE
jgi:ABC-2 type transport system ATP-binding protein